MVAKQFKLVNITAAEHDDFVKNHKYGGIYQLTTWAKVKAPTYYSKRIAIADEQKKLVGVAQLLFRKVPKSKYTFCYMPNGAIFDYNDSKLREFILRECVKIAKQENAFILKMDPNIERVENPNLYAQLEQIGFKHTGFNYGFDNVHCRFTMVADLSADEPTLFKNLSTAAKRSIKVATNMGLTVEKVSKEEINKIDTFYDLLEVTSARDGFLIPNKDFFRKFLLEMGAIDCARLFIVKLNIANTLEIALKDQRAITAELNKLMAKIETADKEKLQKQIDNLKIRETKKATLINELNELSENNIEETALSAGIVCVLGDKAYYQFGASANEFREMYPNYLMQWEFMKFAKSMGAKMYDFVGFSGQTTDDDRLYSFKRKFNTRVLEKNGEFDYILNPFINSLFNFAVKTVRFKGELQAKIKNWMNNSDN